MATKKSTTKVSHKPTAKPVVKRIPPAPPHIRVSRPGDQGFPDSRIPKYRPQYPKESYRPELV